MNKFFADAEHVRPIGRSIFRDGIRYLSWSCSAVEFVFTGRTVSAEIWTDWVRDEPWKTMFQPQTAVFIDGKLSRRFAVSAGTKSYPIYESDSVKTVSIRIVKLSEAAFSKIGIASLSADGELRPTEPRARRMEFIGDSITCGFGIEGKSAEEHFSTKTENPCKTYAALTAERFGAEFDLISWSSIGVYSSDCPEGAETPADGWVMPMLYDYTDIGIENILGTEPEPWDFKRFVPDVIVINLGTNDSSFTRDFPDRTENFKKSYADFVRHIREKNPNAYIICALGMMGGILGGKLFPAVEEAVRELNDGRVFSLELDEQKASDGIGCENHPNEVTHRKAAEELAAKISEITGWKIQ